MRLRLIFLFVGLWLISGCVETLQVPKPRTYPRIVFPVQDYKQFAEGYCDFNFRMASSSQVIRDTSFFGEQPIDDCWFDIFYPDFNGYIHCTYYPLGSEGDLTKLVNDEFKMTDKHHSKAEYIDELPLDKGDGTTGMIFEIEGAVASNLQFYLTDSEDHFFRGSLYFKTKARPDSIAPVYNFVKEDIIKMIDSFEWN